MSRRFGNIQEWKANSPAELDERGRQLSAAQTIETIRRRFFEYFCLCAGQDLQEYWKYLVRRFSMPGWDSESDRLAVADEISEYLRTSDPKTIEADMQSVLKGHGF